MKNLKRLSLLTLVLLLAFSASFATAQDDGNLSGDISLARANWDTGYFQAAIYQSLLSELGYNVEQTGDLAADLFYPAVAEGEDVDMWANGWFPLHETFLEDEAVMGRAVPVGYQVENGALQGYLIDKATADEYGITSITDMTNPEIATLFDTDGDGKSDLTGCNAGWGCELVIESHLDEFDLRDSITHVQGEYSLLMAETINRYERGEPVFFYTWTPNWTINELALGEDVVWITTPEMDDLDPLEGVDGCVVDPCQMGFEGNDIRAVANVEFLQANPAVAALLSQVEIPLEDIAAQNVAMQEGADSDEDIQEQAADWIEDNREQVDEWLSYARENADNTEMIDEIVSEWLSMGME